MIKMRTLQTLVVGVMAAVTLAACGEIPPEGTQGDDATDEATNEASSASTALPQYGDTMWVLACDRTRVTADWSGCNRPIVKNECLYNPPPGWVILENRVTVVSSNNGSRANSTLAGGLNLVTESTLKNAYDSAIDLAIKYQDQSAAGQLATQYTQNEASRKSYQSNYNTAKLTVSAQPWGSCVNRKRGWEEDSLEVKLFYIGSNDLDTLLTSLRNLFGLWEPILLLNSKGLNPSTLISLSAGAPIKVKDAAFTTNNYFLSIQRSDQGWNGFGAEASEWLPLSEGQQVRAGTYSLSTFMARHPEVTLSPGNYYRVKIANNVGGWSDTTRLLKLY